MGLQEVRKAAGHRTAKDFAARMGIPTSTYARYEQQPDMIPTKVAWAIADELGCSIDMVVGRDQPPAAVAPGGAQRAYDAASSVGKEFLSEAFAFVAWRDQRELKRRQDAMEYQYRRYAQRLMELFYASVRQDDELGELIAFGPNPAVRAAFAEFVAEHARRVREGLVEKEVRDFESVHRLGMDDNGIVTEIALDEEQERSLAASVDEYRERVTAERLDHDMEVMAGIMAAYDQIQVWQEANSDLMVPGPGSEFLE